MKKMFVLLYLALSLATLSHAAQQYFLPIKDGTEFQEENGNISLLHQNKKTVINPLKPSKKESSLFTKLFTHKVTNKTIGTVNGLELSPCGTFVVLNEAGMSVFNDLTTYRADERPVDIYFWGIKDRKITAICATQWAYQWLKEGNQLDKLPEELQKNSDLAKSLTEWLLFEQEPRNSASSDYGFPATNYLLFTYQWQHQMYYPFVPQQVPYFYPSYPYGMEPFYNDMSHYPQQGPQFARQVTPYYPSAEVFDQQQSQSLPSQKMDVVQTTQEKLDSLADENPTLSFGDSGTGSLNASIAPEYPEESSKETDPSTVMHNLIEMLKASAVPVQKPVDSVLQEKSVVEQPQKSGQSKRSSHKDYEYSSELSAPSTTVSDSSSQSNVVPAQHKDTADSIKKQPQKAKHTVVDTPKKSPSTHSQTATAQTPEGITLAQRVRKGEKEHQAAAKAEQERTEHIEKNVFNQNRTKKKKNKKEKEQKRLSEEAAAREGQKLQSKIEEKQAQNKLENLTVLTNFMPNSDKKEEEKAPSSCLAPQQEEPKPQHTKPTAKELKKARRKKEQEELALLDAAAAKVAQEKIESDKRFFAQIVKSAQTKRIVYHQGPEITRLFGQAEEYRKKESYNEALLVYEQLLTHSLNQRDKVRAQVNCLEVQYRLNRLPEMCKSYLSQLKELEKELEKLGETDRPQKEINGLTALLLIETGTPSEKEITDLTKNCSIEVQDLACCTMIEKGCIPGVVTCGLNEPHAGPCSHSYLLEKLSESTSSVATYRCALLEVNGLGISPEEQKKKQAQGEEKLTGLKTSDAYHALARHLCKNKDQESLTRAQKFFKKACQKNGSERAFVDFVGLQLLHFTSELSDINFCLNALFSRKNVLTDENKTALIDNITLFLNERENEISAWEDARYEKSGKIADCANSFVRLLNFWIIEPSVQKTQSKEYLVKIQKMKENLTLKYGTFRLSNNGVLYTVDNITAPEIMIRNAEELQSIAPLIATHLFRKSLLLLTDDQKTEQEKCVKGLLTVRLETSKSEMELEAHRVGSYWAKKLGLNKKLLIQITNCALYHFNKSSVQSIPFSQSSPSIFLELLENLKSEDETIKQKIEDVFKVIRSKQAESGQFDTQCGTKFCPHKLVEVNAENYGNLDQEKITELADLHCQKMSDPNHSSECLFRPSFDKAEKHYRSLTPLRSGKINLALFLLFYKDAPHEDGTSRTPKEVAARCAEAHSILDPLHRGSSDPEDKALECVKQFLNYENFSLQEKAQFFQKLVECSESDTAQRFLHFFAEKNLSDTFMKNIFAEYETNYEIDFSQDKDQPSDFATLLDQTDSFLTLFGNVLPRDTLNRFATTTVQRLTDINESLSNPEYSRFDNEFKSIRGKLETIIQKILIQRFNGAIQDLCNPLMAYDQSVEIDQQAFSEPFNRMVHMVINNPAQLSSEHAEMFCRLALVISNGADDKLERAIDIYRKFNTQWPSHSVDSIQEKMIQIIQNAVDKFDQNVDLDKKTSLRHLHSLIVLFETLKDTNPHKKRIHASLVNRFVTHVEKLKRLTHPSFIESVTMHTLSSFLLEPEKVWPTLPECLNENMFDFDQSELENLHLATSLFVRLKSTGDEKQKLFFISAARSFMKKLPEFVAYYTDEERQKAMNSAQNTLYVGTIFELLIKCLEIDHTLISPQLIVDNTTSLIEAQTRWANHETPESLGAITSYTKNLCQKLAKQILEIYQNLKKDEKVPAETLDAWKKAYAIILKLSM